MTDGPTHKLTKVTRGHERFLQRHDALLVVLSGGEVGMEFALRSKTTALGRGAEADLRFDDPRMADLHAGFEVEEDVVAIRALDPAHPIKVNAETVEGADLEHGDRIEIGGHVFQFVLEEHDPPTRIITLPEE